MENNNYLEKLVARIYPDIEGIKNKVKERINDDIFWECLDSDTMTYEEWADIYQTLLDVEDEFKGVAEELQNQYNNLRR